MSALHAKVYRTITGRAFDLKVLGRDERRFLVAVLRKYRPQPEWSKFASWWLKAFGEAGLPARSTAYRICQGLEARLGIAQEKISPPDYRDYLADLIEERFGSRYGFCKKTRVDPGHLSRVPAGKADLSLETLRTVLAPLHAVMTLQLLSSVSAEFGPGEATRALAAVGT